MTARATKVGKRTARAAGVTTKSLPDKKRATSKPAKAKTRKLAPLEKLREDESTRVLLSLIRRHPELRREANELALALIETVDAGKVGSELGQLHRRRWPLPDESQELIADWPWFTRRAKRKKQR